MLTIFLSGGMTGLSREQMTGWRDGIKDCVQYCDKDIKVISPTDSFMNESTWRDEDKEAFVYDTSWVKKSDVIIAEMSAPNSIGTAQEIMLAYEYKKPIVMIANKDQWYGKVHPWLKQESTTVFFYDDYYDKRTLYADVVDYALLYE